jgi:catalase
MSQTSQSGCPFEHIEPQEAKQITEIADLTVKRLRERYRRPNTPPKPTLRGVHPKSHGCIRAIFTINADIKPEYRIGLFANPGQSFSAFIRFSNANALVGPDTDKETGHDSRGMAIKVLDVGSNVLEEDNGAYNQDFLMINQENFAFANTEDYLRLTKILDRDNDKAEAFFDPLRVVKGDPKLSPDEKQAILDYMRDEAISSEAITRMGASAMIVKEIHTTRVANPLGIQYFSAAPFLFGPDRVMKFSANPCRVEEPTDIPSPLTEDYLTDALTQTMQWDGDLQFDFMIQVRDAKDANLEIENASSKWDKVKVPFEPVAKITIHRPQRDVRIAEHKAHCEKLAFTPWHSLAAHQPVGSINRLRREVYQKSAEHRLAHDHPR